MQRSIALHCSHYFHCPKCKYDLCPACAGVEESPPPGLFGGAPAPAAGLFGGPSMYPSPQLWKLNLPGRDYNIRSGPSLFASVVTTVTHGTMLQMKGEVNGWLILEDGRGYTVKQPQNGIGGWHRCEESMLAPPADLFGSAQSPPATASPSASAPPASSLFGSPPPTASGAAVLRVEGAGAYYHVQGDYRVDVAAGLKDGVPCYIKVGDPSVASGSIQVPSTITRRDGKWWIASSLSNQPPSMLYSAASTGDKPPPTGWGRDGCMPLPTGLFAPSADKMALMPSIVPLAAGAVASAPIAFSATGGSISSAAGSFGFGVTAPAAAPAFGGGSCTAASSPFGGAAATSPFGGAAATSPFGGAAFGGAPSFGVEGRPGATTASAPSSSPFGGPPAGGVLFGSPASATAPPFAPSSSPFGGPPAGGVLFGSPASVITSPFMPAPAASSVFGPAPAPPPPTLVGSQEAATASSFGAIATSAPEPSAGECVLLTSLADEL